MPILRSHRRRFVPLEFRGSDAGWTHGAEEPGGDRAGGFNAFVQFYLANVVIVVLLSVFARLTAAYLKTHALNEASQKLAHTDFATGVPNRRHLYAALEREIPEAPQEGSSLAVIVLDLNDFGHDTDDRVLEGVAQLVNGHLCVSPTS